MIIKFKIFFKEFKNSNLELFVTFEFRYSNELLKLERFLLISSKHNLIKFNELE